MSEDKIVFNNICWDKQCPEYVEWEMEGEDGHGINQTYIARSCQKVGQSYEIYAFPDDCLFLQDLIKFQKDWEQAVIWEKLTPWNKAKMF